MVYARTGIGYETLWGIISLVVGTFFVGFLGSTILNLSASAPENALLFLVLGLGISSLFMIYGIYKIFDDYNKRKQLGFVVYWRKVLKTFISFEPHPRIISTNEIGHYKTQQD